MNNTRFATVVHILTFLTHSEEPWSSSEWIAGSININPVIVRKELGFLQEKGWVMSKKGKEGGAALKKSAEEIMLADVYQAVKNTDVLGKRNQHTNPTCPVGRHINRALEALSSEADRAVLETLQQKTLADFVRQFY